MRYNNPFLDGLEGDWRGWKYDPICRCERCIAFEEAIYIIENCYNKS